MTIDEFKAMLDIAKTEIKINRGPLHAHVIRRKCIAGFHFQGCWYQESGHTEKAALKKLKDVWYYEGRKNGSN